MEGLTPNYFIGNMQEEGLVMTQIKNFHQFRPSFDYVDEDLHQRKLQVSPNIEKLQIHETKKWQKFKDVITNKPSGKSDLHLDLDHVETLE